MDHKSEREYKMSIDPKILKLLGPNLYTNIYYVLAELIANAYDADAKNVYIISKPDRIIVEDDGIGMSYSNGDVAKYLNVAAATRSTYEDSLTPQFKRRKIGRKGVGKLAALSVSENILVRTIKESEKSGFVLSIKVNADNLLTPLAETDIVFEKIMEHGTSIVMQNPHYELNKTPGAIKRNLLKIFPLVNKDFRIHIIQDGTDPIIVDSFDKEIVPQLGGIIILGETLRHLGEDFVDDFPGREKKMLQLRAEETKLLQLVDNQGVKKEYPLVISGWIGFYRSTKGRKSAYDDFPDNFISIFSNNKLGEYNILPVIGKNRLPEVFVVGQFHVNLFEETELPDMALSNRQGYKTDDLRYKEFILSAGKYLAEAVEMRVAYAKYKEKDREIEKLRQQELNERDLREKVDSFKREASLGASKKIAEVFRSTDNNIGGRVTEIIKEEMGRFSPIVGIKQTVDDQKKKILRSTSTYFRNWARMSWAY